jgi:hypothetical protein
MDSKHITTQEEFNTLVSEEWSGCSADLLDELWNGNGRLKGFKTTLERDGYLLRNELQVSLKVLAPAVSLLFRAQRSLDDAK